MKIKSLKINNLRGIREQTLTLDQKNLVIWGPNGSGKSAVVDAIDFLLTGAIPRLKGEGTEGVKLLKHGPHVDFTSKIDKVSVSAELVIPGSPSIVKITRSLSDPRNPMIEGANEEQLAGLLTLAERKQHSLSRREILDYIAAKKGTRSEQIQIVLDLQELEKIRITLGRVARQCKQEREEAARALNTRVQSLLDVVNLDKFSTPVILKIVNDYRADLSTPPLTMLESGKLKDGVEPHELSKGEVKVNVTIVDNTVQSIHRTLAEQGSIVIRDDGKMRAEIAAVQADADTLRATAILDFLKNGNDWLDETGKCPFCGHVWNPADLKSHIEKEISGAERLLPQIEVINKRATTIMSAAVKVKSALEDLANSADAIGENDINTNLTLKIKRYEELIAACNQPLEKYMASQISTAQLSEMFKESYISELMVNLRTRVHKKAPKLSPQQHGWTMLTKLETTLLEKEKTESRLDAAKIIERRADDLNDSFLAVREAELNALYDSIKDRFVELYKFLHSDDEVAFEADLLHDGKFEVDFYGRGKHPPVALHSEGHQDSMGLCLYLALAEKLTSGTCMLTVLDDVVMSIDAGHRKQVCKMLIKFFPDRQFLITTHDKTWARQLRSEGIVSARNSIEFCRWSIDSGPSVAVETDMWSKIGNDLKNADVESAAHKLRYGSEQFFEAICDSIGGSVRYRSDGMYTLADYMNASIGRLKKLLKRGSFAAESWGKEDLVQQLRETETVVGQVVSRTYCEQWAVNASVHYNNWCQLGAKDFESIVEAFKDCYSLFTCSRCLGTLSVLEKDNKDTMVSCPCQETSWLLVKK